MVSYELFLVSYEGFVLVLSTLYSEFTIWDILVSSICFLSELESNSGLTTSLAFGKGVINN